MCSTLVADGALLAVGITVRTCTTRLPSPSRSRVPLPHPGNPDVFLVQRKLQRSGYPRPLPHLTASIPTDLPPLPPPSARSSPFSALISGVSPCRMLSSLFCFALRLKAAGAYAHATSAGTRAGGGDFCRANFLHGPTMERSVQLRHQLAKLVNLRFGSEPGWRDCDVTAALKPPSRRQSDALRQVQ